MCGIAGQYSLSKGEINKEIVRGMGRCIRHRGPDQEGEFFSSRVGLMIERLKVIDLSTGDQPIFNETKDVVVVFNGEIYNYKELRERLEKKGHKFYTNSDTETIVHLYEEHGEEFVTRLNGMFAIALWDAKEEKLILARDRAGVKPLFYSEHQGRLYFGSEMKSILSCPGFPKDLDGEAFHDYLSFYYVCAPRTIYRQIHRLPQGCLLIAQKDRIQIRPYWDLRFEGEEGRDIREWEEEFRSVLDASVKRHLQSDVPVGVYLSGGLDSASIAEAAGRFMSGKVKTYSVGYEEKSFSELNEARQIANMLKTDHHEIVLTPQKFQERLSTVIAQFDEPHGDWSHVANDVLSEEAKKDVTVVLTGTGGDELLGGYPTYYASRVADIYREMPDWFKNYLAKPLANSLPVSFERMPLHFMAQSFLQGADYPSEEAHRRFKEIFNENRRADILTKDSWSLAVLDAPSRIFTQYQRHYSQMNEMVDRLMYLDFKVFMAHCALHINDITTSMHSLEARVPFLDLEMIQFAQRLPTDLKVRGMTTKYLMRRALQTRLPRSITNMKKKGFLIPGALWIQKELKPYLLDILPQAERELSGMFNFKGIRELLAQHFERKQDHTRRIFCLFSFFIWHSKAKPSSFST